MEKNNAIKKTVKREIITNKFSFHMEDIVKEMNLPEPFELKYMPPEWKGGPTDVISTKLYIRGFNPNLPEKQRIAYIFESLIMDDETCEKYFSCDPEVTNTIDLNKVKWLDVEDFLYYNPKDHRYFIPPENKTKSRIPIVQLAIQLITKMKQSLREEIIPAE